MNFLAIDTSAKYLSVVAYARGRIERDFAPDCALRHSVVLMERIDAVLGRIGLAPKDCDFFAAVTGPGSFTGIRIGVSTVKGLCLSCGKPALAVTSFDTLAYAEGEKPLLALADAGHGMFYACRYDEKKRVVGKGAFLSRAEAEAIVKEGYVPVAAEEIFERCLIADPCEGLANAALSKRNELAPASALGALYLRKSSAEENRK